MTLTSGDLENEHILSKTINFNDFQENELQSIYKNEILGHADGFRKLSDLKSEQPNLTKICLTQIFRPHQKISEPPMWLKMAYF